MSEEMIVDPHPDDVLSMAIRQRDAARADRNSARNVVAEILDHFTATGSGHTARVGQVQIAKWRKAAGLTT